MNDSSAGQGLPPAASSRGQVGSGVALTLVSASSGQTGAAVGALAFPAIGPIGVVAVRQLIMASVFFLMSRPRLGEITRRQWPLVIGLGLVFGTMNILVYTAIERIGLGLTVTLEFLGPLAVALSLSRRLIDLFTALTAGIGVVVLVAPGPTTDVIGVVLALLAGVGWASYVLLNKRVGAEFAGLKGTAAASLFAAVVWLPIGVWWFALHPPPLWAIGLAVVCALLSSVVPFAVDLLALRRISSTLFSTLTSLHPLWAALAGLVILGQIFSLHEWIGMLLIVFSNVVATLSALRRGRRAL